MGDSTALSLGERPWTAVTAPAEVLDAPSMLSNEERGLLYWLARDYFTGAGRIVDGGCFLGGSTIALARGLSDRNDGPWERTISSYDRFVIYESAELARFSHHFPDPTVGSSFRSAFDRVICAHADAVEVNEGDISEIGWSREPIEIFFIDVSKSWVINDVLTPEFFPHLIPGRSIIVHQDFFWYGQPWLPITMELLADSFHPLDAMPHATAVFLTVKPVDLDAANTRISALSGEEKMNLMNRAVERWSGDERGLLELSRARLIEYISGEDAALRALEQTLEQHGDRPRVRGVAEKLAARKNWTI